MRLAWLNLTLMGDFKAWNNYSVDAEPQANTFPMMKISPVEVWMS